MKSAYRKKRRQTILVVFLVIAFTFLSACGSGFPEQQNALSEEQTDRPEEQANTVNMEENRETEEADRTQEEAVAIPEEDDTLKAAPTLPETGKQLADFVPEGWELWDSVELDFNEDGITDYVGVLQEDPPEDEIFQGCPRILFAIAGDGAEGYRLDFQNADVIRARDEGGLYGDPYMPLAADGVTFTTHACAASIRRWWEHFTYTYKSGTWWLTSSEEGYGYKQYVTDYSSNDWESGVGIRKKRDSNYDDMEKNRERMEIDNWDSIAYDLEYEVPLDDMQTLEQAGKRRWLATRRVTDWEIREIVLAEDVTHLEEDRIEPPEKALSGYCDEDCMLYTFSDDTDPDAKFDYLAMYRFPDNALSVLREEETAIYYPKLYKGKIYYTTEIVEEVAYQEGEDGEERIEKENDTVGISLHRMEPDGSGMETVFTYRYPKAEQEVLDDRIPYLSLSYEIGGDEIVAEVYVGDEPHPFYRMRTDGSGCEKIGQTPKE
ncbi:MAG: hypothetical protein NC302_06905 [Bacteroidales bacterium]|nr:hypothetical protein [Bacteroidales bacterium]MCM1415664.1 hypothetical protein [bacterium]MCM1423910.1 hypothetical protein [bacterium]